MRAFPLLLFFTFRIIAQIPAPALQWSPWQPVITCRGAEYFISFSEDDGRNDFEVRLRAFNRTSAEIATRFQASFVSEDGAKAYRRGGGGRLRPIPQPLEGGAFSMGVIFQTPVNQVLPVRIRSVVLDIDTADVSKLPPYAGDSVYLNDFTDFPVTPCHGIQATVPARSTPVFVGLTETCYNQLPNWIPACNKAVDALIDAANAVPEEKRSCLLKWRQFQKCYEIYAYGPNPDVRPQCQTLYPNCEIGR